MWAFTKTPLGRLALALRDNEHRVRFLGFNTHMARTIIFAISCLFTGVAGALLAIANEATNYTIFSTQASANVVLQTFIGGAGTFFGPALGAAIMTFFARVTSDLTRSWLLYQGLIFVLVMLFAPEGLGGLVALHARKLRANGWRYLVLPYLLCLAVGLLLIAGLVFVVESIHVVMTDAYFAKRAAAKGAWVPYQLFGRTFDPTAVTTWLIPIAFIAAGAALLPVARRITAQAWLLATQEAPPDAPASPAIAAAKQGATA
jgi:branched-chain amino acid transport system permease protein